jgi:4-amino-4-deoxy-L-arabinose transferase-like glycosyltransferase/Tfp pilus assembly protein PilF
MEPLARNLLEDRRTVWGVFLIALIVRLVYILQIDASPLFTHPAVDAETYAQHALRLAGGNWLGWGEGPFWQPPLYPYFLGAIRVLFSDSFFYAARFFQAVCGAFSCLLIYWIGGKLLRPAVGLMAGLAVALYGPMIFFDGELLPASLATVLDLAGLALLIRALEQPSPRRFLGAGAMFGLGGIAVPTVLLFALVAAVWIWRREGGELRLAGAFLLGVALMIAPVTLRNLAIGGDTVLISYNSGINFYIGNNPAYPATIEVRPGWEWDDLVGMPLEAGIVRHSEKSNFFLGKSWTFIKEQPFSYVGLLLEKTAAFWHGDETGRNQAIYFWRNYSGLLAVLLWKFGFAFPFGLVAPLALFGLLLSVRREGVTLPVLFVLSYGLGVILFFVTARYRIPVMPLLLLFAAHGLFYLIDQIREGGIKRAGFGFAVCLLFALLANWRVGGMDMEGDAAIHYNLGNGLAEEGKRERAKESFERAVELDPAFWQAWFNLGTMRAVTGDMAGAAEIFAKVSEEEGEREKVWLSLAHAHLLLRQQQKALKAYWQALRVNPHSRQSYVEVLTLFLRAGDEENAERVLRQAISYHPRDEAALRGMYARMKREAEKRRAEK